MSDLVICVEGLSKRYHIGQHERYYALRDVLARSLAAPLRRLRLKGKELRVNGNSSPSSHLTPYSLPLTPHDSHIWALKDVSFEVKQGEVVGIIGRNGAGKSTLLKILSRITKPTEGCAKIHGRVGSLLEVGTGFHPELTGRENIYLNGAILGMRKAEIGRKFDEIVAFAEVEKFIDTPVKHYSSGMHMRLAFAVAAHLEPEILLVDEVLAVGDIAFQKKCLGKMGDVARGGRTVLFVSHQMNQIRRLCERCIWLDGGRIRRIGHATDVVCAYEAGLSPVSPDGLRHGDQTVTARFVDWRIVEPPSRRPNVLASMGPLSVNFILEVNQAIARGAHGIALITDDNQTLWGTAQVGLKLPPGVYDLTYHLPHLLIQPGVYHWKVSLHDDHGLVDLWDCVPAFIVATQPVTHFQDEYAGILNLPYDFHISGDAVKSKYLPGD